MKSFSPEVLIYIQSVKHYFDTNLDAKEYFLGNSNEELFYTHLSEISQKNFDKDGEVMLNKEQFELLRKTTIAITIATNIKEESKANEKNIFMELPNFGNICLN